jgi:hypothetical protein
MTRYGAAADNYVCGSVNQRALHNNFCNNAGDL